MVDLSALEHRTPDEDVARIAGVSLHAVQLVRDAELVDLQVESYIPSRLWGYDLFTRNERHFLGGRFFGHLDFPRALDGGLTGGMWSITTNVMRTATGRWRTLQRNVADLCAAARATEGRMEVVRTASEWRAARGRGAHAALIAVQGGNAYDAAPSVDALADVTRVTVMHLTNSRLGRSSSPIRLFARPGLSAHGRQLVERLDAARMFVDLAHIDREGFWHAVDAHDPTLPLIDTHTGVTGVKDHWRNIDDSQIRAIADTGGVIGIMFHSPFLRRRGLADDGELVLDHLEHLIEVGGESCPALGSDYDGAIVPPLELRDGFLAFYRLVHRMLARGWPERRIRGVLGENFVRSFSSLRP